MNAEAAPDGLPAEKPGKNLRGAILWTVGILVALGLAWFIGAVAVPYWQVRRQLDDLYVEKYCVRARFSDGSVSLGIIYWCIVGPVKDEREHLCSELGGKMAAAAKLRVYLALPERLAPQRNEAIYVLSNCGRAGVRPLIRQASAASADTRCAAAWALGEIGPDAAEAVPALERLRNDPNEDTKLAAKRALRLIRPQP